MMTKGEAIERVQAMLRVQGDPARPLSERLKLPGRIVIPVELEREASRLGHRGEKLAEALHRELKGQLPAARPAMPRKPIPGEYQPTPVPSTAGMFWLGSPDQGEAGNGCAYDGGAYAGFSGSVSFGGGGRATAAPPTGDGVALWYSWTPPDEGYAFISTDILVNGTVTLYASSSLRCTLTLSCSAYQTDPSSGYVERTSASVAPLDVNTSGQIDLVVFNNDSYQMGPLIMGVEPTSPVVFRVGASIACHSDDSTVYWDFCPGFAFAGIFINFIPLSDYPPVG